MNKRHTPRCAGGISRLGAAALLAMALGTASAEPADPSYTVGVINDYANGRSILREQYDHAIDRLQVRDARGINAFYVANNLCVAYLKSGQLTDARSACDRAIATIEGEIGSMRSSRSKTQYGDALNRYLALALSNRGVLFAVSGAPQLAREHFAAALEVRADTRIARVNLARLRTSGFPVA